MARRNRYRGNVYETCDMVQDGCLAELQGRSAWWGIHDGLRHWLGRYNERVVLLPINEALDRYYSPDPLQHLIACEQLDRHLAKLDRLKPQYRCAYMLRRHEGKRVEVVAKILGVSNQRVIMITRKAEQFLANHKV